MVLDDFNIISKQSGAPELSHVSTAKDFTVRLASPLDRLAACMADLVVFFPFVVLVLAPYSRQAKEAQLMADETAWSVAVTGAVLSAFIALILYQTIFVGLFGATPGKFVLRLRVVSIWNQRRPSWLHAFLRALVWSLEIPLLGIPWLAVFSSEKRRPFHDRIADTAVLSLMRKRQAGSPDLPEMSLASGFQAALALAVAMVLALQLSYYRSEFRLDGSDGKSKSHADKLAAKQRERGGLLCAEVRDEVEQIPARDAGSVEDRLQVALSLFAAGQLEAECLDSEAEFALWRNKARPLAYLAKGLALGSEDRAEDYFSQACDHSSAGGSDICRMIDLVHAEDDVIGKDATLERDQDAERAIGELGAESSSYVRLAALRYLVDSREPEKALETIRTIDSGKNSIIDGSRKIGAFLVKERTKALWDLGENRDARQAFFAVSDVIDSNDRVELARWLCSADLALNGCASQESSACGTLRGSVEKSDVWLTNSDIAAIYVRSQSCRDGVNGEKLRALLEKLPSAEGKEYLEALALLADGEHAKALQKLKAVIDTPDIENSAYFLEANRVTTEIATSTSELTPALKSWAQMEPNDDGWRFLGQSLIRRLNGLRSWERALKVGLELAKFSGRNHNLLEQMAIAAQGAGHQKLAITYLEDIARAKAGRAPASESGFATSVQKLLTAKPGERSIESSREEAP